MAAFRSEVAFVCNSINIRIADCLMVCLRGETEDFVAAPQGCGAVVDAPILFPLLCAMLSPELLLVPLARMLASARRGRWSADETTFVVEQTVRGQEAMGPLWELLADDLVDLGAVRVVVRGAFIQWIVLDMPWPAVQRPTGSHFLHAEWSWWCHTQIRPIGAD